VTLSVQISDVNGIRAAGTKIVPSRSLPINAVLPCVRHFVDRLCATKREAAPPGKNWQQCRAKGSAGVCQPRDLDGTFRAGNSGFCKTVT
jgi:hypothetical protein